MNADAEAGAGYAACSSHTAEKPQCLGSACTPPLQLSATPFWCCAGSQGGHDNQEVVPTVEELTDW